MLILMLSVCEFHLTKTHAVYSRFHSFNQSCLFQVNAQVLVSTFCKESQPLMKLGEAMGAVLRSCVASQKPISSVQITTQGKVAAPNPLPAQEPPTGNAVAVILRGFCSL